MPRISYTVQSKQNRSDKGLQGTIKFACVDGEGIRSTVDNIWVDPQNCIDCSFDLTHRNRYWISEKGPYCRNCYAVIRNWTDFYGKYEMAASRYVDKPSWEKSANLVNQNHIYALFGIASYKPIRDSNGKWISREEIYADQIENPDGLYWQDVFEFIYMHYEKHVAYCGFVLGYDFNEWLKTAREERIGKLLKYEEIYGYRDINGVWHNGSRRSKSKNLHGKVLPVDMENGWQVDTLSLRKLVIRKRSCNCDLYYCKCPGKGPLMTICDAGPFFQTSFLNVIDPKKWVDREIASSEWYQNIKRGKDNRAAATKVDAEMREYNNEENGLLCMVLEALNEGFKEMGISLPPSDWYGPGRPAQYWLKKKTTLPKQEEFKERVPKWYWDCARRSYFGGRFEDMIHGIIPGWSYEYDKNSAYPDKIRNLPCLMCGTYTHGAGIPPDVDSEYTLVYLYADSRKDIDPIKKHSGIDNIGTLPHRTQQGKILQPVITQGWYWLHELRARLEISPMKVKIWGWKKYEPDWNCPHGKPLSGVEDLYKLRKQVGKETAKGKACKLAYNSMYGKFAQSVGHPIFGNPIYASLITAHCRVEMLKAIASYGENGQWEVTRIATDSTGFMNEHQSIEKERRRYVKEWNDNHPDEDDKIDDDDRLGMWSRTANLNTTQMRPGVSWSQKTRNAIRQNRIAEKEGREHSSKLSGMKSRGFAPKDFAPYIRDVDRVYAKWHKEMPEQPIRPTDDKNGPLHGWPNVAFKSGFALTSCLQAIRQNKWHMAGHVENGKEVIEDSNPFDKREGLLACDHDGRLVFHSIVKMPRIMHNGVKYTNIRSVFYNKRFGMEDPWSLDRREMHGILTEGPIPDLIHYALELGEEGN